MRTDFSHTKAPWAYVPPRSDAPSVCGVSACNGGVTIYSAPLTEETKRNAMLIASSPELLASCKELRDALAAAFRVFASHSDDSLISAFENEMKRCDLANGIGVRADKAIARAEGK